MSLAADYEDFEIENWFNSVRGIRQESWKIPEDLVELTNKLRIQAGYLTPIELIYDGTGSKPAQTIYPRTKTNPSNFPKLIISKGILPIATTYEELACVMAHELGHIVLKHYLEQDSMIDSIFDQWIAQKLKTIKPPFDLKTLNEQFFKETSSTYYAFKRDQENEADRYSVDLVEPIGIDPENCQKALFRLQSISDHDDLQHDPPLERAEQLEQYTNPLRSP